MPRQEDVRATDIIELEKLLSKVDDEEWVNPLAKRFIMSGIRMSIACLRNGGSGNGTTEPDDS